MSIQGIGSTPVMTGGLESMMAQLVSELGAQEREGRGAVEAAETQRHETALEAIEEQRDGALSSLVGGLVGAAGAGVGGGITSAGGDEGWAAVAQGAGTAGKTIFDNVASNQKFDAATINEEGKTLEHSRQSHSSRAGDSKNFKDSARDALREMADLRHQSTMTALRV